jgi:putative ABC transport system permease protein
VRLIEGRAFTDADTTASLPVVVVNRTFATRYLGDAALGAKLPLQLNEGQPDWEVMGVVDDLRQRSVTDPAQPEIFASYRQRATGFGSSEAYLVVRTASDPAAFVPTLRALVREQDPSLALESVMTMEDRLITSLARPRLYAVLLGGFAIFALAIAGVGLFGVLSYSVAQRAREIGVRTALGARPLDIVRLVVGQGLAMTLGGLAFGLAASFALVRYLSTFLYGVTVYDAVSFVAVPIVLAAVAGAACVVPARRAARVDPLRVLKAG